MRNVFNTERIVAELLINEPETRRDNDLLNIRVYEILGYNTNLPYDSFVRIKSRLRERTIERCRRKLQEKYPELRDEKTAEIRKLEEQKYIDYSRSA